MAVSEEKDEQKHVLLTDTIIVASTTVLAYLFAFNFEYGIASTYHIPEGMIDVSLSTAIIAWSGFIGLLPVIIGISNVTSPIILQLPRPLRSFLIHIVLSLSFLAFVLTVFNIWHLWLQYSGLTIVAQLMFLLSVLRSRRRNKKPFLTVLEEGMHAASQNTHIYNRVNMWFGKWGKVIFALVLIGYVVSFYLGVFYANWNPKYLVRHSNPEMVVLRIYGDKMICAKFDRSKKELQKDIFILKASDDSTTSYKMETIGPLHSIPE